MGLPAATVGDMTSGHGAYAPVTLAVGSSNVFINSKSAVYANLAQGVLHPSVLPIPPDVPVVTGVGSSTVFINSQGAIRLGDMTVCGGIVIEGSQDVLIG